MKFVTPFAVICIFIGLLHLSSCSKKNDEANLTRTELLTNATWKLTTVKVFGLESPPETCSADDVYTFAKDGTYAQAEGTSKCNPPNDRSGTWAFTTNETKIKITSSGVSLFEKEIVEITSGTLRVKYNFIFDIEETYSH